MRSDLLTGFWRHPLWSSTVFVCKTFCWRCRNHLKSVLTMQISTHSVFDTNNKQDILGRMGVRRAQGVTALKTWSSDGVNYCADGCWAGVQRRRWWACFSVFPAAALLGPHLGGRRPRWQQRLLVSSTRRPCYSAICRARYVQASFSFSFSPVSQGSDSGSQKLLSSNTFESVRMRWMKLEPTIQSEVSQKEKHQYSILAHIYGI